MYLLDTNVISEYRKGQRANPGIIQFFDSTPDDTLFLPVQAIGEIQAGISKLRRQENLQARQRADSYYLWLENLINDFGDHVLQFDVDSARVWGSILSSEARDPHSIDKQIVAIALVHQLTVVTRDNGEAFTSSPKLKVLNPFVA